MLVGDDLPELDVTMFEAEQLPASSDDGGTVLVGDHLPELGSDRAPEAGASRWTSPQWRQNHLLYLSCFGMNEAAPENHTFLISGERHIWLNE